MSSWIAVSWRVVAEAELLGIDRGGPVLTMERVDFDAAGKVIEVGTHCYRPDLYSFETTLVAKQRNVGQSMGGIIAQYIAEEHPVLHRCRRCGVRRADAAINRGLADGTPERADEVLEQAEA